MGSHSTEGPSEYAAASQDPPSKVASEGSISDQLDRAQIHPDEVLIANDTDRTLPVQLSHDAHSWRAVSIVARSTQLLSGETYLIIKNLVSGEVQEDRYRLELGSKYFLTFDESAGKVVLRQV